MTSELSDLEPLLSRLKPQPLMADTRWSLKDVEGKYFVSLFGNFQNTSFPVCAPSFGGCLKGLSLLPCPRPLPALWVQKQIRSIAEFKTCIYHLPSTQLCSEQVLKGL